MLRGIWRLSPESNRGTRLCRPLHNHSATQPEAAGVYPGVQVLSSVEARFGSLIVESAVEAWGPQVALGRYLGVVSTRGVGLRAEVCALLRLREMF